MLFQILRLSPDLCIENMTTLSLPPHLLPSFLELGELGFTLCVSSSSLTPPFTLFVSMQTAAFLNPLGKQLSYTS